MGAVDVPEPVRAHRPIDAAVLLSRLFSWYVETDAIVVPGALSSFLFPFLGIARAKWERPRKRPKRALRA